MTGVATVLGVVVELTGITMKPPGADGACGITGNILVPWVFTKKPGMAENAPASWVSMQGIDMGVWQGLKPMASQS